MAEFPLIFEINLSMSFSFFWGFKLLAAIHTASSTACSLAAERASNPKLFTRTLWPTWRTNFNKICLALYDYGNLINFSVTEGSFIAGLGKYSGGHRGTAVYTLATKNTPCILISCLHFLKQYFELLFKLTLQTPSYILSAICWHYCLTIFSTLAG